MNGVFHAAAGLALGGLTLGGEATRADLALCALAGTSPDWDIALLLSGRPAYHRFHRTLTHGFPGLALAALIAGAFFSFFGKWEFGLAAFLWLIAAGGHTISDLFNRSGVALLAPFSMERTKFPAVSWANPPLTIGALTVAVWVVLAPESRRFATILGLGLYAAYVAWRLREPIPSDSLSRWWFDKVFTFSRDTGEKGDFSAPAEYQQKSGD
ncbi:MAG: metal-dependent hydrolase [bacterium]